MQGEVALTELAHLRLRLHSHYAADIWREKYMSESTEIWKVQGELAHLQSTEDNPIQKQQVRNLKTNL